MNESKLSSVLIAFSVAVILLLIANIPSSNGPEAEFEQWKADRVIYSAGEYYGSDDPSDWAPEDRRAARVEQ